MFSNCFLVVSLDLNKCLKVILPLEEQLYVFYSIHLMRFFPGVRWKDWYDSYSYPNFT